ncbi:hypothetical protein [Burkholderia gladioli]
MRDYAKVAPKFWTSGTGKEIRARGSEGVIVALYLMSSPHSNMLGLYYQPKLYMAHETGLGIEGASKGLTACVEAGFCAFDEASEMVWVFEMASYQIADELKAADRRCVGIQKDYEALPNCPFLGEFFDRYQEAFHLKSKRIVDAPSEAPSKPHRSQEQEQEQEYSVAKATGVPPDPRPNDSQGDLLGDQPAGMTAQEAVWSLGVPMLVAAGQAERNARSHLGKWCKAYGAPAVQAAIVRCAQEQPLEPVSWLIKALGAPKAANSGQGARSGGSAPGGDWWAKAGFAKEYEATNAGCSERYAHLWRNGERIPDAERRAMAGVPR